MQYSLRNDLGQIVKVSDKELVDVFLTAEEIYAVIAMRRAAGEYK